MKKLDVLKTKRIEYSTVCWKSSGGVKTRIWDVDDNYLLNIMRSVSKSLTLYKDFPTAEFSEYNGVKYTEWQRYLMNEYLYRQEVVEQRYREYLDNEIYVQSVRDRDYYDDKYDYGCLGDIY